MVAPKPKQEKRSACRAENEDQHPYFLALWPAGMVFTSVGSSLKGQSLEQRPIHFGG